MPQTRSKGAPASRVYSSSPAPQQVHFPSRKRTAQTYGKQSTKRSLRQQTITQIDFLEPLGSEELDKLEEAEEREFERRKRRRTEGNEVVRFKGPPSTDEKETKGKKGRRKTDGDGPSSSFHTQTLTQLYGDETIHDSEDENGAEVGRSEMQETRSPSVIPQTPLKKKTRVEIPSSQPSPCTPMLARYSPLGPRTSPLKSRSTNVGSPLPTPGRMGKTPRGLVIQDSFASGVTLESGTSQASVAGMKGGDSSQRLPSSGGRRTDEPDPQGNDSGSGRKRVFRRAEIPDSDAEDEDEDEDEDGFDFTGGDTTTLTIPDTPTKPHGPGKRASRLSSGASPDEGLEAAPAEPDEAIPNTPMKELDSGAPSSQRPNRRFFEKRQENESDMAQVISNTPTARSDVGRGSSWRLSTMAPKNVTVDDASPAREDVKDSYPAGPDTQFAMDFIASEENALQLSGAPRSSRPSRDATDPSSLPSSRPPHKPSTLGKTPQRKETAFVHFSSPHISFEDEVHSPGQNKTQVYTQMGSQRVDVDVIRAMPAATGRSDVFISIYPEHVEHIVDGTKDHEFRTWKLPVTVSRIWIYVTKPESRLRYMACVGPAKERGQLEDESGLGNAEFNRGEGGAKFAHEILELYELNNPVSMNRMRENGWLEVPPQRFTFMPPVIVSQLQANLRCRILPRDEDEDEDMYGLDDSQPRDSQEVEAQLLSDIAYSTQRPVDAFSQGIARPRDSVLSFEPRSSRSQRGDGPWQARPGENTGEEEVIPASQATTASDESVPRPPNPTSSIPVFHDSGSPVRMPEGDWGMDTSQLVGPSQLLPDTLLKDHGPPEDFDL